MKIQYQKLIKSFKKKALMKTKKKQKKIILYNYNEEKGIKI